MRFWVSGHYSVNISLVDIQQFNVGSVLRDTGARFSLRLFDKKVVYMRFKVLKAVHREGAGKNGKSYSMDICSGVLTNDDKTEEVGELVLPKDHVQLVIGKIYDVELTARTMQGRVEFVPKLFKAVAA